MTIEQYWQERERELRQVLQTADTNLTGRYHAPEVAAFSEQLSKILPNLFRKGLRQAQWRIIYKRKAGLRSIEAAYRLGQKLRKNGKLQLMMYGRPSKNPEFPLGMWLVPGGEKGWFAARDFQKLDQERIRKQQPMILVSCAEGIENRTLYTIYPERYGLPLKWQVHWNQSFQKNGRSYNLGETCAAAFAEVSRELTTELTRYQELVTAQLETLRRTEVRDLAWAKLNYLPRQREIWEPVCLPDAQVIELLKMADMFMENHPAKPQGLLLKGVSGTGKTLLASTIAKSAGCKFFPVTLADLKHPHLGASGQKVRELWKQARENAPAIIFIDESESVFGKRGATETDVIATDVVQSFLSEWNGKDKNVWLIAATNRRDMLDEAIVSRFDHEMEIALPSEALRTRIFTREMREVGFSGPIPAEMGNLTQGMSGRDLAQLTKKVQALAHPRTPEHKDFLAAVGSARNAGNTPVDKRASWKTLILPSSTIQELKTMCSVLRDSEGWKKQGVILPDGLLLVGPPGTGKTEVARTIANESGLAFIAVTTGEVKGQWVGHSVNRVKNIFERARSTAPAILFIDELDIVAPCRGEYHDSFQEEIVGQLLQEMNGIRRKDSQVFLLAATNHPERVDPAIRSRMQKTIEIPLPDNECRWQFLEMVLNSKKRAFDLHDACTLLAAQSGGTSKRDLNNWVARAEQAAIGRAVAQGGPQHFKLTLDDLMNTAQAPAR